MWPPSQCCWAASSARCCSPSCSWPSASTNPSAGGSGPGVVCAAPPGSGIHTSGFSTTSGTSGGALTASGEGWMPCAHVPGLPAAIAVLEGTAWHRRPAISSRCIRLFCPVNSAPCSEAALEGARCSLPEASRTEAERAPGAAWSRSAPTSRQRH